ncbi:DNA polymerase Y family protein [Aerophototrophica crusticola]|uniref:DNA polymerase Y family protein n=1 Tax=Aerophototrophica crusticola TaxID=1709002 RepID=A0A858R953_9PROT|nr:DNA polymerase Y family protein [Rhodospirillaceae bacterium B3]
MSPASPRRILSLWLPCLATDRLRRRLGTDPGRPLVAVAAERGRLTVAAADRLAQAAGVGPGLPLADARALEPGLAVADADPAGDSAALGRLCDWAQRYTPVTAIDPAEQVVLGAGGLWLDVTGCTHLFGGEAGLLEDLALRLERAGLESRVAIADTAGAAWALARFGGPEPWPLIAPPGDQGLLLAPLPVAALRLPAITASGLKRVGLRRVGNLAAVPRAALAGRYGPLVAQRLDQALGTAEEALSPRRAVPPHVTRLAFAEPVSTPEDMRRCLQHLLSQVCKGLEAAGQGARRLVLSAWRVDGGIDTPPQLLEAGTSRPNRDPAHLLRLFEPKLDTLEPGPGFEVMALTVPAADDYHPEQASLPPAALKPPAPPANVVRFPLPGERVARPQAGTGEGGGSSNKSPSPPGERVGVRGCRKQADCPLSPGRGKGG